MAGTNEEVWGAKLGVGGYPATTNNYTIHPFTLLTTLKASLFSTSSPSHLECWTLGEAVYDEKSGVQIGAKPPNKSLPNKTSS